MKLVLVRHSLPELDPTRPGSQWHLCELGRLRSKVLANRLAAYPLDVIVSSNEPKAFETAQIVADRLNKPMAASENLHEHERNRVPFGTVEQFEKSVAEFFANPSRLVFGDETADAAYVRFSMAMKNVLEKYPQKNIATVAHGTVITLYVSRLANLEPFAFWKRLGVPSFVVLSLPGVNLEEVVEHVE